MMKVDCKVKIYISSKIFFFNDTATTEIYTLSLHDALPISFIVLHRIEVDLNHVAAWPPPQWKADVGTIAEDRKSTRLNSSHANISYAVFCLKKKTKQLFFLSILSIFTLLVSRSSPILKQ